MQSKATKYKCFYCNHVIITESRCTVFCDRCHRQMSEVTEKNKNISMLMEHKEK